MILYLILLIATAANGEDTYENSTGICENRCNCIAGTETFTLNCTGRDFHHIISNWPVLNQTIIASFSGNNIITLELLPPTDAVVEVTFSHCGIKYLNSGLFSSMINIKFVDLSYNLLTAEEVSADKFKGPYNDTQFEPLAIEHLNLAYNQIHSLGKNIFEHMPNLKTLNLEGNDFRILDIHTQLALTSVPGLQRLNLANNELTELVDSAIEKLTNLTELNLAMNEMDYVPSSLVHIRQSLETLILDDNPILEFIEDTFVGLENVVELSANNLTRLKYVNANTFVPMVNLKRLSLSNNLLLTDIDREAFRVNTSLQEFYLNNNRLYRIDFKLLNWSQLHVFEFKENPLDCSCDLYNITNALPEDITRNEDGPYCIDPRDRLAKQVFYLKSDICQVKSYYALTQERYLRHRFSIPLMGLSIVVIIGMGVAIGLVYTRYRRLARNRGYPFASQVLYNPLTTNARF